MAINESNSNRHEDRAAAKPRLSFYQAGEHEKKRLKYAASDVGQLIEIVGVIFAETGGDAKNRPFLDALIGIAKGRLDWDKGEAKEFPASRQALAKQLQKSDPTLAVAGRDTQLQRVERMSKRLFENQYEAGVVWVVKRVVYNPETRKNESTRYRLPIFEYALEAFYRAKNQPERYQSNQPGSIYERAAREVAAELIADAAPARKNHSKPRRKQSVEHLSKQALGMMCKLRRQLQAQGYDDDLISKRLTHLATEALADAGIKFDPPQTVNHGGIGIVPPRDSGSPGPSSTGGRGVKNDPPIGPGPSEEEGPAVTGPLADELADVEAFESVGCISFDLSLTGQDKAGRGYFPGLSGAELKQKLIEVFDMAERDCLNTIIRPRADEEFLLARIIQLDDLDEEKTIQVAKLAFRVIETSPGNYQAFIAGDYDESMRGRLIAGLGADAGANGWTRIAGSMNVKPEHHQPDGSYHRVRSVGAEFGAEPGRFTNESQLSRAGLLNECRIMEADRKPSEKKQARASTPSRRLVPRLSPKGIKRRVFPDYQKIARQAPSRTHTDPDRSSHDFVWSFISADWGHTEEETVEELLRISPKAQERGRDYAERTVAKAFAEFRKALAGGPRANES